MDDNLDGILARHSVLEELGYVVTSARSGSEALKIADETEFDLIITDFKMPHMNGVQLIASLRERNFKKPVILLSGYAEPLGLSGEATGADAVIQKSANEVNQLMRVTKRLLTAPTKPAGKQTKGSKARSRSSKTAG